MDIETLKYSNQQWTIEDNISNKNKNIYKELNLLYLNTQIVGCSSSGNILGNKLENATIVVSAILFNSSSVKVVVKDFEKEEEQIELSHALGLVVSCVGRRIVLNPLTDEELEIGTNISLTGFYSYGELAPYSNEILSCQLHNQTMTLTTIYEN